MARILKRLKFLSLILSFTLILQQTGFAQMAAQLNLGQYLSSGNNLPLMEKLRLPHLRYFSYDRIGDNFQLLFDKGDLKKLSGEEFNTEAQDVFRYFLTGISLPNSCFWVNLRPDSEKEIIDGFLEQTEIGKIMLEADLQLKKDTAMFTSPQTAHGREYWDKLYKKAGELFGSENITIPTLTRPWIVPGEVIVRYAQNSAYIYKATLKVMLEQDYLKDSSVYNFSDSRMKELNEYSSGLIRQLIIPDLTKEVNNSKRYAKLRQVYYSLILAQWFKTNFSGDTGKSKYANRINSNDLTGILSEDWSKMTYFKDYQKSFQQGEYNIKEQHSGISGQTIRSYFSGGIQMSQAGSSPLGIPAGNDPMTKGLIPALAGKGNTLLSADVNGNLVPAQVMAASSPVAGKLYSFSTEGIPDFERIENNMYAFRDLPQGYLVLDPALQTAMADPKARGITREYDLREHISVFTDERTRAFLAAQAVMAHGMGENNNRKIVIAADQEDYNQTGVQIGIEEFKRAGFEVYYINRPSTAPLAYMAALLLGCDNIAFFSASHNPYGDKGLKVGIKKGTTFGPFGTRTVTEIARKGLRVSDAAVKKEGTVNTLDFNALARVFDYYRGIHRDYLGINLDASRFHLVINAIGGTIGFDKDGNSSMVALLERMGFSPSGYSFIDGNMHSSREIPDGKQPNPELVWVRDATQPTLKDRRNELGPEKIILGIPFDRDADRQSLLDDKVQSSADKLGVLAIRQLASNYRKQHPEDKRTIVVFVDMKCSLLVFNDPELKALNVEVRPSKTGHSYLKWHLRESGKDTSIVTLAAFEQSGHCFWRVNPADPNSDVVEDPLAFIFSVAQYLQEKNIPLSKALETVAPYEVGPSTKFYFDAARFDSARTGKATLSERKYSFMEETLPYLRGMVGELVAGGKYRLQGVEEIAGTNFRLFFTDPAETRLLGSCTFRPSSNEEVLTINIDVEQGIPGVNPDQFIRDIQNFVVFDLSAARASELTTLYPTESNQKLGVLNSAKMTGRDMLAYALANGWTKVSESGQTTVIRHSAGNEVAINLSAASSPLTDNPVEEEDGPIYPVDAAVAAASSPAAQTKVSTLDKQINIIRTDAAELDFDKLTPSQRTRLLDKLLRNTAFLLKQIFNSNYHNQVEWLSNARTFLSRARVDVRDRDEFEASVRQVRGFLDQVYFSRDAQKIQVQALPGATAEAASSPARAIPSLDMNANQLMSEVDYLMRMLGIKDYPRIMQTFRTSIDPVAFVAYLVISSGKATDDVLDILRQNPFFAPLAARYRLQEASIRGISADEHQSKNVSIKVTSDGYIESGVQADVQGKLLSDYLSAMRDLAPKVPFVFRDKMDRFVARFLGQNLAPGAVKTEPDLLDIVQMIDSFLNDIDLNKIKYIVTSGIGANEMYSRQLAALVNASAGKIVWIVVNNPAHLENLPTDANSENTIVFEMSRSGSTKETADFFNLTKDKFKQRIVAANPNPDPQKKKKLLNDFALELQAQPDAKVLIIDNTPGDIGGRQMNRETLMVFAPLYIALNAYTGDRARALLADYCKALYEANQRLDYSRRLMSPAVSAAEFLLRNRLAGRNKFALLYDDSLKSTAKEMFQLINEGANKNIAGGSNTNILDVYSLGTDGNAPQLNRFMQAILFGGKGATSSLPIFLLNSASKEYQNNLRIVSQLQKRGIPCLVLEVNASNSPQEISNNLRALANLSGLLQDTAVYFTFITNQDANSNPAVKLVRELTPLAFEIIKEKKARGETDITITFEEIIAKFQAAQVKGTASAKTTIDARNVQKQDAPFSLVDFKNGITALATGLGITEDALVNALIGDTSKSVLQTDVGEAGGSSNAQIGEAFSRSKIGGSLGATLSPQVSNPPLNNRLVLADNAGRRVSVAVDKAGFRAAGSLEEQLADYLYTMYTTRKGELWKYLALSFMEVDADNPIMEDIGFHVNLRLADLDITTHPLALPGVAHTGIEAVMSHPESLVNVAIMYTNAYGEGLGTKEIEPRVTVDDATYAYGVVNVIRMALAGTPSIIFEVRNKGDLPFVQETVKRAIDIFSQRITAYVASASSRESDTPEAGASSPVSSSPVSVIVNGKSLQVPVVAGSLRKTLESLALVNPEAVLTPVEGESVLVNGEAPTGDVLNPTDTLTINYSSPLAFLREADNPNGQHFYRDNYPISNEQVEVLVATAEMIGLTTNLSIFKNAAEKGEFDQAIAGALARGVTKTTDVYDTVTMAAFKERAERVAALTRNREGRVDGTASYEVPPNLIHDAEKTRDYQARIADLGAGVVMVKTPITAAGLRAIRMNARHPNIIRNNLTLMFGFDQWLASQDAELDVLEERVGSNLSIENHFGVDSFFLSRTDIFIFAIYKALKAANVLSPEDDAKFRQLLDLVAVSQAKMVGRWNNYVYFGAETLPEGTTPAQAEKLRSLKGRFDNVNVRAQQKGLGKIRPRVPLWASTMVKDGDLARGVDALLYFVNLIGPNTVNTMPDGLIKAIEERFKGMTDAQKEAAIRKLDHAIDNDRIITKYNPSGENGYAGLTPAQVVSGINELLGKYSDAIYQIIGTSPRKGEEKLTLAEEVHNYNIRLIRLNQPGIIPEGSRLNLEELAIVLTWRGGDLFEADYNKSLAAFDEKIKALQTANAAGGAASSPAINGQDASYSFPVVASSPSQSRNETVAGAQAPQRPGGIDFRYISMVTQAQLMDLKANFKMPALATLKEIDLASEGEQIEKLMQAGIIPSSDRIIEYVSACYLKSQGSEGLNKAITCLADYLKLQEDTLTETDTQLKAFLAVIDSDKLSI